MASDQDRVSAQIQGLARMQHNELKALWHTLYGNEPPTYNRAYIINRLAYRIQELTFGGLSEDTRSKMRRILAEHGYDSHGMKTVRKRRSMSADMPAMGTKLVREWNGRRYEVMVVPGGVEYLGKRYRSLSAVATIITGSHWNGRVFFGLDSRSRNR